MKVIFLGVGEAFDENLPNNSHLILSDTKMLLDCGFSSVAQMWKYNDDQEFLDTVYITHGHADHYFGLPSLFDRMCEEKRKKPLTIICQKGLKETIIQVINLGYKNLFEKLNFDVNFIEVEEGQKIKFNELELEFASTTHLYLI